MIDLERLVRPGDGIVAGEACGEPCALIDALIEQAPQLGGVELFVGMTFTERLATPPEGLSVSSYGALGSTRRIAGLRVIPAAFSSLPRLFARHALPGDVAFVQVAPPDEHGRASLGVTVDYIADALEHARTLIVEVNADCPPTRGAWIDIDRADAVVESDAALVQAPAAAPQDIDERIAAHVAPLVDHGDTVQIGVGALPEAILRALHGHRGLKVHSGLISDGILALLDAGAVSGGAVTGAALGTRTLFDALRTREDIAFAPVSHAYAPTTLAAVAPLVAINSPVELDRHGQLGGERANGREIGAAGGQLDFMRAAVAGGGRAITVLPAARIVASLSGPVTVPRSDVDWVVTEHGARRLHGLDDGQRERALTEISSAA